MLIHSIRLALFIILIPIHLNTYAANDGDLKASTYQGKDNLKAIQHYNKQLQETIKSVGSQHPLVATIHTNLGNTYDRMDQYDPAILHFQKALDISIKNVETGHPSQVSLYNKLGSAYKDNGNIKKALEIYLKGSAIDLKKYRLKNIAMAKIYNNIGIIYKNNGNIDKAIRYYKKSLEIKLNVQTQSTTDNRHVHIDTTYNNLSHAYEATNNIEIARLYAYKALNTAKKTYVHDHIILKIYLGHINELKELK